ncbi:MAG: MFS transporter [Candidatus Limnocylindria bacterium]
MANPPPVGRPDQPRSLPLGAGARAGLKRGFASLHIRNYRLYWSGQVVSLTGTWMQQVSLPWLVLVLGGSPLELGLVAALQFLPAGLLAPFGGVFADRIDKRRALLGTHLAAMAQAATLFTLTASGVIEIPMVMAAAFWLGLVNAVDMPVRQSMAADLVPRETLPNAIALNSMAFNSARVAGPAVAGVIIALGATLLGSDTAGVAINLAINTFTYSAVMISLLRMDPARIRRHERPERHPPVLSSLREGVGYAARTPLVLWSLVLLGGVAAFGFNFQILLPLFATEVLALNADGYGALYAAMGIGSLSGSLTLAFMRERRALPLMLGGGVVFGVLEIGLGLTRSVWLAAPLILGVGFFSMLMINTINATVQANVTDALRGRVMSLYVTVFAGTAPLGGLFAGAVAEAWGVPLAFVIGAGLSLLTVGIVAWGLRSAAVRGKLGVTRIDSSGEQPPSSSAGARPVPASASRD